MSAMKYPGYIPSNVSKDAKYSVKRGDDGDFEVTLVYRLDAREKALLATKHHVPLVEMVNAVKLEHNGVEGGAFYINEFLDVLVPTTDGITYFAGTYQQLLEFEFDGEIISPRAAPDLKPGDVWRGPHVGIRYKIKATGRDISYQFRPRPQVEREELLSDVHGEQAAAELATRLNAARGQNGGRIYINECGEFFAPPPDLGGDYTYLGALDDDVWFPAPDVPRP